jgi:hypothetical protein
MKFDFAETEIVELHQVAVYKLAVTCTLDSGETLDPKIFIMCRSLLPGVTVDTVDVFCDICCPDDLDRYPPDAPDGTTEFPFYRTNHIVLEFASLTQYAAAREALVAKGKMLRRMQEKLTTLAPAGSVSLET